MLSKIQGSGESLRHFNKDVTSYIIIFICYDMEKGISKETVNVDISCYHLLLFNIIMIFYLFFFENVTKGKKCEHKILLHFVGRELFSSFKNFIMTKGKWI